MRSAESHYVALGGIIVAAGDVLASPRRSVRPVQLDSPSPEVGGTGGKAIPLRSVPQDHSAVAIDDDPLLPVCGSGRRLNPRGVAGLDKDSGVTVSECARRSDGRRTIAEKPDPHFAVRGTSR